ncbi:probable G-protein coupled receptor 139 [Heterodontus francisci]|uniref:probable G-protein coupled receptor 139 n=1 Tax=Heterodontus francisci TaxID=7792 RepID=UPI00355B6362
MAVNIKGSPKIFYWYVNRGGIQSSSLLDKIVEANAEVKATKSNRQAAQAQDRESGRSGRLNCNYFNARRLTVIILYYFQLTMVHLSCLFPRTCGLSKCITRYLVAMALADLMVVIIHVMLHRINIMYFPAHFLFITPVCVLNLVMSSVSLDCSVWFTVAFTFDRFVAICCQKLQSKYNTEKTAAVVIATVFVMSCLRNIPFYYSVEPVFRIDDWYCVSTADYFTSPLWRVYKCIHIITNPLLPILLILLFNALTVKHIIVANRARRGLRSNSEKQDDPEVKNQRKSMILLFTISANFMLLWMTYVVHLLNWPVKNFYYTDKYNSNAIYITQQVGFMLQFLSCCSNTCIYGLAHRKFGEELQNGLRYVFTLIEKLCQ